MTNGVKQMNKANRYQSGIVTTFTGVMILVLLTLMMFFAIRVGVFEQRVSANEMRQKEAFHAAEAGINYAKEFILANGALVASDVVDLLPNGEDGWLAATTEGRWQSCAAWASANSVNLQTDRGSHPCFGMSDRTLRPDSYFYSFNNSTALPLNTNSFFANATEQVTVEALLCVMDVVTGDDVPVKGCVGPGDTPTGIGDGTFFMVTILARGEADCTNGACIAESLVSEQVSNFGATAGGNSPNVPLSTRSTFPPSGTAEVVPNPNAGGKGVPISVWMNANASCSNYPVIDPSSGSWATCEYHEWYETDDIPDNVVCPGNCSCDKIESISYTHGNSDTLGIDLVQDDNFPCDLFQFYFGVPRTSYPIVKGFAKVINDCSTLGPNSFGMYWVSGSECSINSNTEVGSPGAPVMLISAATLTRLNGGAEIFGTLFVTDVEDSNAELRANGTATVYGAVIVDGTLGSYNGTFQVVWNENIASKSGAGGGLGSVLGGWSDFHRDWE